MLRFIGYWLAGFVLASGASLIAQDLDAAVSNLRQKRVTILDEIGDPKERLAFKSLYGQPEPAIRLKRAETFLAAYSRSWLLAEGYEIAAKASIDMGRYDSRIDVCSRIPETFAREPFAFGSDCQC